MCVWAGAGAHDLGGDSGCMLDMKGVLPLTPPLHDRYASGSMDPFISACKTYISAIISAVKVRVHVLHLAVLLLAIRATISRQMRQCDSTLPPLVQRVMLEKHKKAADFRASFIAYRDFGDVGHLKVTPFTHEIATCVEAVTKQSASGGGDTPEDVAGGLKMAASLPWRERSANFLILICDAPCHNSGGKVFHSTDEKWGEPETSDRKRNYDRAPPAGCDTSVQRIDPDDQLVYLRDTHKVHFMVTEMSTGSVTRMIEIFEVGALHRAWPPPTPRWLPLVDVVHATYAAPPARFPTWACCVGT